MTSEKLEREYNLAKADILTKYYNAVAAWLSNNNLTLRDFDRTSFEDSYFEQ